MAADNDSGQQPPQFDGGSTTVLLPKIAPPTGSSRYKMLKLHAQGGMGEIWLAEDQHIGRQVAFKRIRAGREQQQDRFFTEAQVTGQLEHPGIVPVHELGTDENAEPFYVMRLVQGRTLKEVIADFRVAKQRGDRDRELQFLRLLEMFVALCRTMSYAHARGVIHRDLKPDNVMIGRYGETLVVDWGLCRISGQPEAPVSDSVAPVKLSSGHASTATQDGEIIGSPPYMSPEMAAGRVAEEDARTDVYLLGATLYEMLTGRPPRLGASKQEIVELARTAPPAPPRTVDPQIPRALEAICLKAMAHRKEDRYESAEQVAEEVERFVAGEPVQAYPEPLADRVWRWIARHRAALGRGMVAAVVLTIVAASVAGWRYEKSRREEVARELALEHIQDEARRDREQFHRLAEDFRFQLADTVPLDETVTPDDPTAAERTWQEIARLVGRWQPDLSAFPLAEEREALKKEYVELLLWRVQNMLRQAAGADQAKTLLAELNGVEPAHASYHWLRADCLALAGEHARAEQSRELSQRVPKTAFDHFLEGEEHRAAAVANPNSNPDDREIWRPSRRFMQAALTAYEQGLALDQQQFWGHVQKGRSHLVREEFEQALAEFDLAVALRPQSAAAWTVRGLALGVRRQFPAALHDLNYALKLKPDSFPALLNRGTVHRLQGDFPEAQKDFAAALRLKPGDLRATYYMAHLDYDRQQLNQALAGCNTVLNQAPEIRPARLLRMQIHWTQLNKPKALADLALLTAAPGDTPNPAATQAASGCELLRLYAPKLPAAARRLARTEAEQQGILASNGGVNTVELFDHLGAVQLSLGKTSDVIATLGRALACDASPLANARIRLKRGMALVEEKDLERAKEDYSQAAKLAGSDRDSQVIRAEARSMLAFIAARQSSAVLAEHEAALAMAEFRDANDFVPWFNLACAYAVLSEGDSGRSQERQEMAMTMLSNTVFQAGRAGAGYLATAITLIRTDDALKSLHTRADFQDLIAPTQ